VPRTVCVCVKRKGGEGGGDQLILYSRDQWRVKTNETGFAVRFQKGQSARNSTKQRMLYQTKNPRPNI